LSNQLSERAGLTWTTRLMRMTHRFERRLSLLSASKAFWSWPTLSAP